MMGETICKSHTQYNIKTENIIYKKFLQFDRKELTIQLINEKRTWMDISPKKIQRLSPGICDQHH